MDNKPGFTGDRALPEATAIMARQADRLYEVGDELKKRPILRAAVVGVASELGEAAEDAWPYAREYADDLAGMERLAREEVAAVAKAHVVRLPSRSGWRRKLMEVGELDHEFAVERLLERRMGEDPEEAEAAYDRLAVLTPEERRRAEAWVTHKLEDAVSLNSVKDVLDGCDRWSSILHALWEGSSTLTDRQMEDLRGVADAWRRTYAKELEVLDADHVDRPSTEKELAAAGSLIATLDRAERVTVDA